MEWCGVTTILNRKLEPSLKARIQRLGVPCTVWLIRGCLPNTRVSCAVLMCWWRKDSAVTVPQAPKNPYAEVAAAVCAETNTDPGGFCLAPRMRNFPDNDWNALNLECWNLFVGCCCEGDWCLLRKENYHHSHHLTSHFVHHGVWFIFGLIPILGLSSTCI